MICGAQIYIITYMIYGARKMQILYIPMSSALWFGAEITYDCKSLIFN